ncbi:MAG: sulfotransferase [Symploca sp. SIO2G7]|nr:sulfotransferase [Symploca sp. SIO2G7]
MKNSIFKVFRGLNNRTIHFINSGLHRLEYLVLNANPDTLVYPPIFIIGTPRSGSTLLYQVLTDYYNIGYLSNFHANFYGSPFLIERLFHPLTSHQLSNYTSYHGQTQGWLAPSECGAFWYRFFRRKPSYIPLEEADSQKLRQLRASIAALSNAFGKPVLFKNLYCSLRLRPIAEALPESLFIVIHRDIVDNGHSLLAGRKKVYGNYNTWWSAEPPNIEQLKKLPPYQQVIEQIQQIYALINRDQQFIGANRFLDLYYEDFCQDTHKNLRKIGAFLKEHAVYLVRRVEISKIPSSFPRTNDIVIDQSMYSRMVEYVNLKRSKCKD